VFTGRGRKWTAHECEDFVLVATVSPRPTSAILTCAYGRQRNSRVCLQKLAWRSCRILCLCNSLWKWRSVCSTIKTNGPLPSLIVVICLQWSPVILLPVTCIWQGIQTTDISTDENQIIN
jgi:hypothetical protein